MIPLHDDNPTELKPVVTIGLIALCAVVFLYQFGLGDAGQRFIFDYGFIPALLFGVAEPQGWSPAVPAMATLVTSMFLHGGFMHIIGNMLYLWVFGNNVEDALGHGRFVIFYFVCGIAAAMAQGLADPSSTIPMVGASGAIGGVLGAYLLLYPHARILVLIPLGFFTQLIRIPAVFVLGFWFVLQFLQGAMTAGNEGGGVAYWAHIGGFVAGAALIVVWRRPGVTLWHGARSGGNGPFSVLPWKTPGSQGGQPRQKQGRPQPPHGEMRRPPRESRGGGSRIPESGGERRGGPWGR